MKTCSKCGRTEPDVIFRKIGYVCIPCLNARSKAWRDANKERAHQTSKAWYQNNKEHRRDYLAGWRSKNIEKIRPARDEYNRNYRANNKPKITTYSKQYYDKNTKICNERSKNYRENNPEKYKLAKSGWYKKYPEKGRAARAKRRTRIAGNGGSYTSEEWQNLLNLYDNKCLSCGSTEDICADHVVPVIKGGTSYIYNIQPLCRTCNTRKRSKTIDYRPL